MVRILCGTPQMSCPGLRPFCNTPACDEPQAVEILFFTLHDFLQICP